MRRRVRSEHGTALVEVFWFSLLLLLPLLWIVVSATQVQRGAFAAAAAARAAARAYAEAPDAGSGVESARRAAATAFADQGVALTPAVTVTCAGECRAPGSVVTVTVDAQLRLPLMPDALGGRAPSIHVHAASSAPFSPYQAAS